jgi:hypothetical protein
MILTLASFSAVSLLLQKQVTQVDRAFLMALSGLTCTLYSNTKYWDLAPQFQNLSILLLVNYTVFSYKYTLKGFAVE